MFDEPLDGFGGVLGGKQLSFGIHEGVAVRVLVPECHELLGRPIFAELFLERGADGGDAVGVDLLESVELFENGDLGSRFRRRDGCRQPRYAGSDYDDVGFNGFGHFDGCCACGGLFGFLRGRSLLLRRIALRRAAEHACCRNAERSDARSREERAAGDAGYRGLVRYASIHGSLHSCRYDADASTKKIRWNRKARYPPCGSDLRAIALTRGGGCFNQGICESLCCGGGDSGNGVGGDGDGSGDSCGGASDGDGSGDSCGGANPIGRRFDAMQRFCGLV